MPMPPKDPASPIRILFVCTGNICRSPLAAAVLQAAAAGRGLADRIEVDSAGTESWNAGQLPDPRTLRVAERNGLRLDRLARQITPADFDRFDRILVMERRHLQRLQAVAPPAARGKIQLLSSFDETAGFESDIEDPFSAGRDAFERLYERLARCCEALLHSLVRDDPAGGNGSRRG